MSFQTCMNCVILTEYTKMIFWKMFLINQHSTPLTLIWWKTIQTFFKTSPFVLHRRKSFFIKKLFVLQHNKMCCMLRNNHFNKEFENVLCILLCQSVALDFCSLVSGDRFYRCGTDTLYFVCFSHLRLVTSETAV